MVCRSSISSKGLCGISPQSKSNQQTSHHFLQEYFVFSFRKITFFISWEEKKFNFMNFHEKTIILNIYFVFIVYWVAKEGNILYVKSSEHHESCFSSHASEFFFENVWSQTLNWNRIHEQESGRAGEWESTESKVPLPIQQRLLQTSKRSLNTVSSIFKNGYQNWFHEIFHLLCISEIFNPQEM